MRGASFGMGMDEGLLVFISLRTRAINTNIDRRMYGFRVLAQGVQGFFEMVGPIKRNHDHRGERGEFVDFI